MAALLLASASLVTHMRIQAQRWRVRVKDGNLLWSIENVSGGRNTYGFRCQMWNKYTTMRSFLHGNSYLLRTFDRPSLT